MYFLPRKIDIRADRSKQEIDDFVSVNNSFVLGKIHIVSSNTAEKMAIDCWTFNCCLLMKYLLFIAA